MPVHQYIQVINKYVGLSTDTRPSGSDVREGSDLWEADTGFEFKYSGGVWYPKATPIMGAGGSPVTVQNPFPTDGDSIYAKDVKDSLSDVGTFTGADLTTLFNNLDDSITSTGATNPKYFKFFLERPAKIGAVALVAKTGSFKNVKILLKDRQGNALATIDDNTNTTPYGSHEYAVPGVSNVCCIQIEFHTTDDITLSFLYIRKAVATSIENIASTVSEINSSTTVLGIDEVFTGPAENVKDVAVVQTNIYADQDSAASGFSFQFSADGTNWDHTDNYSYIGGTGKTYSIQPVAQFFRIVYTNGGVGQTSFRLQTIYKSIYIKPSSHRVGDLISPEDDAELMKAVLTAQKPDGDFTPIDATAGGNLKASLEEFDGTLTTINADRTTNLDGKAGLNVNSMMYGRVSDSVIKNARLDAVTESLIVQNYEHHEVHEGSHFYIDDVVTLAINNVFDLQFTTPAGTKFSHFIFMLGVQAETEWLIYEGATINAAGTSITPLNNDRNSSTVSGNTLASQLNTTLANANADTDVSGALETNHGKIGAGRTGGIDGRSSEIILKANTIYCMRAIAIAAGYINFVMQWYEHTNRN